MKHFAPAFSIELARAPGTAGDVAKRYGVSPSAVLRNRRRNGVRGLKPGQALKDRAITMRRAGFPLKAIASEVGYCIAAVWNWCEDARANPKSKSALRPAGSVATPPQPPLRAEARVVATESLPSHRLPISA